MGLESKSFKNKFLYKTFCRVKRENVIMAKAIIFFSIQIVHAINKYIQSCLADAFCFLKNFECFHYERLCTTTQHKCDDTNNIKNFLKNRQPKNAK